jgi:hypothetical protein
MKYSCFLHQTFNKNKKMSIEDVINEPFYLPTIRNGAFVMVEMEKSDVLWIGIRERNHPMTNLLKQSNPHVPQMTQRNIVMSNIMKNVIQPFDFCQFWFFYNNFACKTGDFSQNCISNYTFMSKGGMFYPTSHPSNVLEWMFKGTAFWFSFFYPHNLKVLHDSLLAIAATFKKLAIFWDYPYVNQSLTDEQQRDIFFELKYSAEVYATRFENLYRRFNNWIFRHYIYRLTHGWNILSINYGAIYHYFYIMFCEEIFKKADNILQFLENTEKINTLLNGKKFTFSRPSYLLDKEKVNLSKYDIIYCANEQERLNIHIECLKCFIVKHACPAVDRNDYIAHIERNHAFNARMYREHHFPYGTFIGGPTYDEGYLKDKKNDEIGCLKEIAFIDFHIDERNGNSPDPDPFFVIFGNKAYFSNQM